MKRNTHSARKLGDHGELGSYVANVGHNIIAKIPSSVFLSSYFQQNSNQYKHERNKNRKKNTCNKCRNTERGENGNLLLPAGFLHSPPLPAPASHAVAYQSDIVPYFHPWCVNEIQSMSSVLMHGEKVI